jgi:hypothetical protein
MPDKRTNLATPCEPSSRKGEACQTHPPRKESLTLALNGVFRLIDQLFCATTEIFASHRHPQIDTRS